MRYFRQHLGESTAGIRYLFNYSLFNARYLRIGSLEVWAKKSGERATIPELSK